MTRTWEDNAQEYADLDQGEGWPFAVLVACSVEKDKGSGGFHDHSQPDDRNAENDHEKVSATRFAERAGTSTPRVLRYLEGWNRAAIAGVVLPATDLTPADAHKVVLPDTPLKQFYTSPVGQNVPPDRQEKIREQALKDGTGASKAVDIASNPKALAAAIKADPGTADAARKALQDSWDKDYRERWNSKPRPLDDETQERIRRAELTARERELAEQHDKDEILGSMEILSELSHYRDSGDTLVGRWSRRKIKLATAEKEAFFAELAGLQGVVDQLRLLAEGRESVEDELRHLMEEQSK